MPVANRTLRVFVSSTFDDLREERNALAAPGGPFERLASVCRVAGARFQPIDLRWGVREEAGLAWPLADDVTDEALEARLFGRAGGAQGQRRRAEPDWSALARELKRPGVTVTILWEEYREVHPEGYGYSRFCDLLRGFERRLTPRDAPAPRRRGEGVRRLFGQADRDRRSNDREIREAEIFVGVLGASNLTYAEATWTQTLPDWTGAHVRMFRFFGGAPKLLVPDNLKSGVNKASFYDPEINRTYGAMAAHYSVAIRPARPRRPRDKAKVEAGVRFAQTYILGRLRGLTFFSLAECNAAIALVMQRMNERPMRNLGLSRRELFETIGSRREPSRSSIAANASAPISAAPWAASTARTPTTCPAPTGATPSGRRIGSAA